MSGRGCWGSVWAAWCDLGGGVGGLWINEGGFRVGVGEV